MADELGEGYIAQDKELGMYARQDYEDPETWIMIGGPDDEGYSHGGDGVICADEQRLEWLASVLPRIQASLKAQRILADHWPETWEPYGDDDAAVLERTNKAENFGVAGRAYFRAGWYPACSVHGAMHKVDAENLWRCHACGIGIELKTTEFR